MKFWKQIFRSKMNIIKNNESKTQNAKQLSGRNTINVTPDPYGYAIKEQFDYILKNFSDKTFLAGQLTPVTYSLLHISYILSAQPHKFVTIRQDNFNDQTAINMILQELINNQLIKKLEDETTYVLTETGKNTTITVKIPKTPPPVPKNLDLRSRKERKIEADAYAGKSLGKEVDALVGELIDIGLHEGFLSLSPGGPFNQENCNIRALGIGKKLNHKGGISLMLKVHQRVKIATGQGRDLEMAWSGIGKWRG